NDEGKPIVIEPSEHEETFTYDEGFTYDVAKVYKRQTHGELEELISDSDGLSISIWDLRDLLKGE
ncbi:hypothetical protein, partial [Weissella minor]|uniref:hypothetical protein n=1 Tax=Weissella minor TaxID=1620 RepID=UPI00191BD00A